MNKGPSAAAEDAAFGIETWPFKWNAVNDAREKADTKSKARAASEATVVASAMTSTSDSTVDHQFEFRVFSVVFPDGKLSCITGPMVSGKSAILVSGVP